MKVKIITLILLTLTSIGYSQNSSEEMLFSSAIKTNIKTYNLAINKVDYRTQPQQCNIIFNDFVSDNIISTRFDNFKAKQLNGRLVNFNKYFEKPLILTTYASWFLIEEGSVFELNQLAEQHHESVDFAVVFWEDRSSVRKKAKLFNKHVKVLYINERENTFSNEVRHLKYPLGHSLIYYINKKNTIVDLRKNHYFSPEINNTYNQDLVNNSNNQFTKGLSLLLLKEDPKNTSIVSK